MKVVNIVMSGKFCKQVDVTSLPNGVYNRRKFSGAVCEHNGCTFLVFTTGSFVCLGAKKKRKGRNSVDSIAKLLNVSVVRCCVKNMVMTHKLGFCIDLDELYERLRQMKRFVTYENELFNGIVWKELGGTVRLFHTGSFFVTGLCRKRSLFAACQNVCNICSEFEK